jgi:hypothetical protein
MGEIISFGRRGSEKATAIASDGMRQAQSDQGAAGPASLASKRRKAKVASPPADDRMPGDDGLVGMMHELQTKAHVLRRDSWEIAFSIVSQFNKTGRLTQRQWVCAYGMLETAREREKLSLCPHCGGSGVVPAQRGDGSKRRENSGL